MISIVIVIVMDDVDGGRFGLRSGKEGGRQPSGGLKVGFSHPRERQDSEWYTEPAGLLSALLVDRLSFRCMYANEALQP